MTRERLKGGSLSGTYLITEQGKPSIVRKEVSLVENREYGFQRWYSQLKRQQRYSVLFPEIFPEILNFGVTEDKAYFDMNCIENAVTAQEFIVNCQNAQDIKKIFEAIMDKMQSLYKYKIPTFQAPIDLYLHEEVDRRLHDCNKTHEFVVFSKNKEIVFNDEVFPSFISQIDSYKSLAQKYYPTESTETFTHGNITLENILYVPEQNRVVFIDPYEENVIDSILAEYSQLYQSCNGYYEVLNEMKPEIQKNQVTCNFERNFGLDTFNQLLSEKISAEHSLKEQFSIRIFEISQFIRMLPFKMVIDMEKMMLFYALASKLFFNLQQQEKGGQYV